mgnify:CR=1 FL=1
MLSSIKGAKTPEDLVGTILDQNVAMGEAIVIGLSDEETVGDISAIRLPLEFRTPQILDGRVITTTIQRSFDRALFAIAKFRKEQCDRNKLQVRKAVKSYWSCVNTELSWKIRELVNVRDTPEMSSFYGVAVPVFDMELAPWEIVLHPTTANKLSLHDGSICELIRYPITNILPVKIKIGKIGQYAIGVPRGKFTWRGRETTALSIIGGDCDGDTLVVRGRFAPQAQAELSRLFNSMWDGVTTPIISDTCYTCNAEILSGLNDMDVARDRAKQKAHIGTVTKDAWCAWALKRAAGEFLPVSMEEIRSQYLEQAIEVVMDSKKCHGGDTRLLQKVSALETALNDEVIAQLENLGFDSNVVTAVTNYLQSHEKSLRGMARKSLAFAAYMDAEADTTELLVKSMRERPNPCWDYIMMLLGASIPTADYSRTEKNLGMEYTGKKAHNFCCKAVSGKLVFSCGLGTFALETEADGVGIRRPGSTQVGLFRPTVQVRFGASVMDARIEIHKNWEQVFSAYLRSDYTPVLIGIANAETAEEANSNLKQVVLSAFDNLLKTYAVNSESLDTWEAQASRYEFRVLETDLSWIAKKFNVDVIDLGIVRYIHAANFLTQERELNGKVRKYVDFASSTGVGEPMSGFYAQVKNGAVCDSTVVLASDPLRALVSHKRRGVCNAFKNLVEFVGQEEESLTTGAKLVPPVREVAVCCLPIDGQDACIISESLAKKLTVKISKVAVGCDFGSYEYFEAADGSKIQARCDLKGVVKIVPDSEMPTITFADGTAVTAEVVMDLNSTGHEMLRHTHMTQVLTTVARKYKATYGKAMKVPFTSNTSYEEIHRRVKKLAVDTGLYGSDLLATVTGDFVTRVTRSNASEAHLRCGTRNTVAGYMAIGVHRQIPGIVSSLHPRSNKISKHAPRTIEAGGAVAGLPYVFAAHANECRYLAAEVLSNVHPETEMQFNQLCRCIEYTT